MAVFRIGEAARLLGVSDDTLRRWADAGRFASTTTESGRRGVDGAGLVTRVIPGQVMAQVEIQAGPHRIVSLMSAEAVDELGLEPGVLAVATVKSTSVVVTLPQPPRNGPARVTLAKAFEGCIRGNVRQSPFGCVVRGSPRLDGGLDDS